MAKTAATKTAAEIRKALKAEGYNTKEVTAKGETSGYDSIVTVTIRQKNITAAEISEIVKPFEEIRRDGFGGILDGGNIYITVQYANDFIGQTVSQFETEAVDLWTKADEDNSFYIREGARLCNNGTFKFIKRDGQMNGKVLANLQALAEWLATADYGKATA